MILSKSIHGLEKYSLDLFIKPITILTHSFVHTDFLHLFSNSVMFIILLTFYPNISNIFIPFLIISIFINCVIFIINRRQIKGLSTLIYLLGGYYTITEPDTTFKGGILLNNPYNVPLSYIFIICGIYDIIFLIFRVRSDIGHINHLSGFFLGGILGLFNIMSE